MDVKIKMKIGKTLILAILLVAVVIAVLVFSNINADQTVTEIGSAQGTILTADSQPFNGRLELDVNGETKSADIINGHFLIQNIPADNYSVHILDSQDNEYLLPSGSIEGVPTIDVSTSEITNNDIGKVALVEPEPNATYALSVSSIDQTTGQLIGGVSYSLKNLSNKCEVNGLTCLFSDIATNNVTLVSQKQGYINKESSVKLGLNTTNFISILTKDSNFIANTPPTIAITVPPADKTITVQPKNGKKTVSGYLKATVTDDKAIIKVEYYVDSQLSCTDTLTTKDTKSYDSKCKVTLNSGKTYSIIAQAYDNENASNDSSQATLVVKD